MKFDVEIIKKIEYYCAYQERCTEEVHQKLKSLDIPSDKAAHYIQWLKEENFLDDERFLEAYVRGKMRIKKWGKRKIFQKLRAKAFQPDVINHHLNAMNQNEYHENCQKVFVLYVKKIKEQDKNKRFRKIAAYMNQKGFHYGEYEELLDGLK